MPFFRKVHLYSKKGGKFLNEGSESLSGAF